MAKESYVDVWIKEYPSIQKMRDRVMGRKGGSQHTLINYVKYVKYFADFLGFDNPDEALEKFKSGELDGLEKIDGFLDYLLIKRKFSQGTAVNVVSAIKKWFTANGVDVEWDSLDRPSSVIRVETDRAPTTEEIKTLMDFSKIREKVMILMGATSGIRIGTLVDLNVGDVDFSLDPEIACIKVKGKEGRKLKAGRSYFTFITPEARRLLEKYLDYRRRKGETITPDSPLLAKSKDDFGFLSRDYVRVEWDRLLKKAGLNDKGGKWHELHLHTLRKFFRTRCEQAGVKRSYWDFWMGHKGYLDESYFRATIKDHISEYQRAIPALCIVEATPMISREELDRAIVRRIVVLQQSPEQALESVAREYSIPTPTLKNLLKLATKKEEEEIRTPRLESSMVFAKQKKETKESEEDCQRLVAESELETYLARGWRVQAVLPSGKVVIEK